MYFSVTRSTLGSPAFGFLGLFFGALCLSSCAKNENDFSEVAPGAPGVASTWAFSGKTGIGTAYEAYQDTTGQKTTKQNTTNQDNSYDNTKSDKNVMPAKSKVWFSLAQGIVTETMFGLIHEAQLKEMQLYIKGENFFDEEKTDTHHSIEYLHTDSAGRPLSLAYKITTQDKENKYRIEKMVFTDPNQNSLMLKIRFTAHEDNLQPYLFINPHMGNTGEHDKAWKATHTNKTVWHAQDKNGTTLSVMSNSDLSQGNVGFIGSSDGRQALKNKQSLPAYTSTGEQLGNIGITLALPTKNGESNHEWLFTLGFGKSEAASLEAAQQSLAQGYENTLQQYNGEGEYLGWEDYLQSLSAMPSLIPMTTDNGKLLHASALVLKAQEDKTYAGALIASLSNPWGDTKTAEESKTGYKAVWPRDFYQVAMAMLALGDRQTPRVAFEYLEQIQVGEHTPGFKGTGGWFLQKTRVDGELEWFAVQLDQTAMPIMLGWRLWQDKVLSDEEAAHWYRKMLKPAADFLIQGGSFELGWNKTSVTPPFTQQERWEEQAGYSPSSIAATIAGLVCAADLAKHAQDNDSAKRYLEAADTYAKDLEKNTFTTTGKHTSAPANGQYYLRISANKDPNDHAALKTANGQVIEDESNILDAGFLELVRYGVRAANDPFIVESLPELDDTRLPHELRVKYEFSFPGKTGNFPGWRRYGKDGYGEDTQTGLAYGAINDQMSDHQRGRVWPFFTGERAHYEFSRGQASVADIRQQYVQALELFANEGFMLPEQVWDGVGENHYQYQKGEGTNSATPLAWTHAEYVKLLRTLVDAKVWDRYPPVEQRYQQN